MSDELKLKVRNYCILITCFWVVANIVMALAEKKISFSASGLVFLALPVSIIFTVWYYRFLHWILALGCTRGLKRLKKHKNTP
jgi:hypothetical protein